MIEKITLLAADTYVIRSTRIKPNGVSLVAYYETPSTWNKNPTKATLFRDFEAAMGHLLLYNERDKAKHGWADGSKELFDVVPLYGEITRITSS